MRTTVADTAHSQCVDTESNDSENTDEASVLAMVAFIYRGGEPTMTLFLSLLIGAVDQQGAVGAVPERSCRRRLAHCTLISNGML